MTAFIDTTAFVAFLLSDDENHARATRAMTDLAESGDTLLTTNYVVVETWAVLQRLSGPQVVRRFVEHVLPSVMVDWVDLNVHRAGVAAALMAGRRGLSLVDCTSFEAMRRHGVRRAFAFDHHFRTQGFETIGG